MTENSSIFLWGEERPEKNIEAVIEREKCIRDQHMLDIEDAGQHAMETGAWSVHKPLRTLMSTVMPDVLEAAQMIINKLDVKAATRDKCHIEHFKNDPWESFCYIALAKCLDSSTDASSLMDVYKKIAQACEEEAKLHHWQEHNMVLFNIVKERQQAKSSNTHRIFAGISVAMGRAAEGYTTQKGVSYEAIPELKWEPWTAEYRQWVGTTLFALVAGQTRLFDYHAQPYSKTAKKRELMIRLYPSNALLNWVNQAEIHLGLAGGFYLPIPAPPKDWTTSQCGGYWTQYGGAMKLIKNKNEAYQDEVLEQTENLQTVFKAVNAAQRTGWRINQKVFDVLEAFIAEGKPGAGLPSQDDVPMPCCPRCGQPVVKGEKHDCFENNPDLLKEWKAKAHNAHIVNNKSKGQRLRLKIGMEIASLLRGDGAFYFVYQTDFRGRLYPVSNLSPRGTDWEKGVLEFAEGVPLGIHGAKWLAVNLANHWGNDKVSYEERVKWALDNEEWILRCAREPLIYREWQDADAPFQFLASAIEWAGYCEQGESYVSHVSVGLDGSCSGIQHYSAMLRDEEGALATNVKMLPGQKKKADIYGKVAEVANNHFKEDLLNMVEGKADSARILLMHKYVDRKVTKRAVMTLPYGSTFDACFKYVCDALNEKFVGTVYANDESLKKQLCAYTAKVIWASIPEVVEGARLGMAYLKTMARLVCKGSAPVTWTAPTGFPVMQAYFIYDTKTIKTALSGTITCKNGKNIWKQDKDNIVQVRAMTATKAIDSNRQVSGIAPNFIHSLDASHLMFSVVAASEAGMHAFALVHDSLGTHAGNTEEFFQIIRRQFHRLYSEFTPLKTFTEHIVPQIPDEARDKVPEMPMINTLNVDDILNAEYLFS